MIPPGWRSKRKKLGGSEDGGRLEGREREGVEEGGRVTSVLYVVDLRSSRPSMGNPPQPTN